MLREYEIGQHAPTAEESRKGDIVLIKIFNEIEYLHGKKNLYQNKKKVLVGFMGPIPFGTNRN
jgi:hypothetical protein